MDEPILITPSPRNPRYFISSHGDVYSRQANGSLRRLNPFLDDKGYRYVHLPKDRVKVAVLVIEAFVGTRPPGAVVRHLDDVKTNDRLSNLAYGTHRDNYFDAVRNGRIRRGKDRLNPDTP